MRGQLHNNMHCLHSGQTKVKLSYRV